MSCDYHDAAAALVIDGRIVAACEEERFTRRKHDSAMPANAVAACLRLAQLEPSDVDVVVVHEKPLAVAARVLAARQRRGAAALPVFTREAPALLGRNLLVGYRIQRLFRRLGVRRVPPVQYAEHHLSHAAAAFLPSPFESAAILTVDGAGEWSTAAISRGVHGRIEPLVEQRYPHSIGLFYSLMTAWCGFEPNEGEYKLMGLASYGEPSYLDRLASVVTIDADGSVEIDARLVSWWGGAPASLHRLAELLGLPPRLDDDELVPEYANLARSVQELTELSITRMAEHAHRRVGGHQLCLGGGVAMNCVANGRLLRDGPFDRIWVQPAPGDAGSAIGAALWYWHGPLGHDRVVADPRGTELPVDAMAGAALGIDAQPDEVRTALEDARLEASIIPDLDTRCEHVARRLADGAIVGWYEGRMEFGPRALGHRSILADPRSDTVAAELNRRVKGRESFRPFAPSVLWERAAEWFDIDAPAPYMQFTCDVVRDGIPACTHVDGTARVQTVHGEIAPAFDRLLRRFEAATGCPVLLNTSFNRAGEPIVATPADAIDCALAAGLDVLVLDEFVVELPSR